MRDARTVRRREEATKAGGAASTRAGRASALRRLALVGTTLLSLFAATAPAQSRKDLTPRQIADLYRDSVVGVRATGAAGVATGAGFFYEYGTTVATSYHVIKGATRIEVVRRDGRVWNPVLVAYDEDTDVALLEFDWNTGRRAIPHGPSDTVGAGDPVVVIGDPLGMSFSVSAGIVAALRSPSGVREIQFTAPISHGSSGGPVIDAQGRAIGIVRSTLVEGQNLNLAVSTAHARRLLKETSTIVPFSRRLKSAKDFYRMGAPNPDGRQESR